jgi:hypothetical protein
VSAWHCYRPDAGQTVSDAVVVEAADARRAADNYAAQTWNWEMGDCIEFEMVDERGCVWEATVDVETVPDFYPSHVARKAKP